MLTLRPAWPRPNTNDWSVFDDGETVGRIYEDRAAHLPEGRWFWALNGAACDAHQAGVRTSGRAATLAGAKDRVSGELRGMADLVSGTAGLRFRIGVTYIWTMPKDSPRPKQFE
jgi:hypothetical protein